MTWFSSFGMGQHIREYLTLCAGVGALLFGVAAHAAIPASERATLVNLYAYTDGGHWDPDHRTGWNGPPGTECNWYGITCDGSGSTVTAMDLSGAGLYGRLPDLSALKNVESLDFHQTATSGIGAVNEIFGPLPELSALTKLRVFYANNMYALEGDIPALTELTNLVEFKVFNCQLSGSIPPLSGLTHLTTFDVHNNRMAGEIPALTGLTSLVNFTVYGNHLTGPLPDLTGLTDLQTFHVGGNQLTGGLPDLGGLQNLNSFDVGGNLLDGHIETLSNLPNLQEYSAGGNFLTGGIPSLENLPNLQIFLVDGNYLDGSIPDLSNLPQIQSFVVAYNHLTGSLPATPPSLVSAATNLTGGAGLCPNLLTPASNPPSAIDLNWNAATVMTPWSQDCSPNPLWKTTLGVDSNPNPSRFGQTVTFTARVFGMNPTGTVTFTTRPEAPNNTQATTLCIVPLAGSVASCTVDNFAGDTSNVVIAAYSGDANNAPADNIIGYIFGNVLISTIDQLVSAVVDETTTADTAQTGQPVDLEATITGGSDGDTVTFYDGQFLPLCAGVPISTFLSKHVAHCIAQFSTVGPHSLMAKSDRGGSTSQPLIENIVAPTAFDADQFALTGSWFNPPTSGQGLELMVYPDLNGPGSAFLFGGWFTDDASSHLQWVTLQGNAASSHGSSYTLGIGLNTGGNFNALPTTATVADGTATLTFYDCTHAAMTYQFNDGRSGTIPYVRLTPPAACSSAMPAVAPSPVPAMYNDALHSGAWFDPATSGQGLLVDIVPSISTFFAAWYTYVPQSEGLSGLAGLRWLTLQASYTPGNLSLHDVPIISTSGGVFNAPTPVTNVQVGKADITFNSCTSMTLKYVFDQGEFNGLTGTINERFLGPVPNGCQ